MPRDQPGWSLRPSQRETMVRIYAKHCGRQVEEIERDVERDFFMTPEQARDYGLIDSIVDRMPAAEPK